MLKLLSAATAANSPPADTQASITITAVAGSALVDGERFTIMREDGVVFTFEFDSNSSVTNTDILRKVTFAGGNSSSTVATAIATVINASDLKCTATASSATVTVKRNVPGPQGNGGHNTEGVANGTFAVGAAFTSGALAGFALLGDQPGAGGFGWRGEDRGTFQLYGTGDDVTLRAYGRSKIDYSWQPMGSTNADETLRGVLHAGVAIEDEPTGILRHNENVSGLSAFDRVYGEIVSVNGSSKSITLYLVERE